MKNDSELSVLFLKNIRFYCPDFNGISFHFLAFFDRREAGSDHSAVLKFECCLVVS